MRSSEELNLKLTTCEKECNRLHREMERLRKALAGALANLADASRARGEAEGKLAASEMAGVLEKWKDRAERAERAETRALAQAQDWRVRAERAEAEEKRLRDLVQTMVLIRSDAHGNYRDRAERAEAEAERLREALRWCSGSADFCDGGQAHEGWMKICQPLLNAYNARAALEGGDNAANEKPRQP